MAQDYSPEILAAIENAYAANRARGEPRVEGYVDPTFAVAQNMPAPQTQQQLLTLQELLANQAIGARWSAADNDVMQPGLERMSDPMGRAKYPGF